MFRNLPNQKIAIFAYIANKGAPKTGDAANIICKISKDGGAAVSTNDVNPTELDAANTPGIYIFDMTQEETNAGLVMLSSNSITSQVIIEPLIIYTELTLEEIIDAVWDESLTGATHNIPTSAGRRLRDLASNVLISGISPNTNGTANTAIRVELNGDASTMDGCYDPGNILIYGGTGAGQSRQIWEYHGATTKYAYINRDWKEVPDDTSQYIIYGSSGNTHVNEGLAGGGTLTSITLNYLASEENDTYKGQVVFLAAGVGQDQYGIITAYNGTTKVATIERAWAIAPVDGQSIYCVLPNTGAIVEEIANAINVSPPLPHGIFGF